MAREINKLTARFVDAANKPGRHSDGGNLYLSISPKGSKRWVFFYRIAGRQREMGLGSASRAGVSLATARERAADARAILASGRDPLEVKKTERRKNQDVPSFGEWADAYVETHRAGWRNKKHADQWAMTLTRYCASIRDLPVSEVDTDAVLEVLQPIWERLPETAQRLRGRIENVLDAAKSRGLRTGENPARWRGHLSNLLSKPKKLSRGHHAALAYAELPAFMAELKLRKSNAARALEFTILTASRTSEVLNASWCEFDFDKAVWTIPEARMKAGREHRVPLLT
ncbi:MAG: integrase arm-type DNA-binding domain-containing protein [Rhizobiaceae bacterium]